MDKGTFTVDSPFIKGAVGFVKNKTYDFNQFSITPRDNGAIFVYSSQGKPLDQTSNPVLVAISEVKNRDSGWHKKDKFDWGNGPTLLRHMDIEMTFNNQSSFYAKLITNRGKIGRTAFIQKKGSQTIFSNNKQPSPWFALTLKPAGKETTQVAKK